MCRLCTTVVEGRAYCPRCFDLLYRRGSLSFTQSQFTLPAITLGFGILALVASVACCILNLLFSVPLGIVGLTAGIRALKEHTERPDLPNRGITIAGITLAGVALLASAGQVVFWILAFSRR